MTDQELQDWFARQAQAGWMEDVAEMQGQLKTMTPTQIWEEGDVWKTMRLQDLEYDHVGEAWAVFQAVLQEAQMQTPPEGEGVH